MGMKPGAYVMAIGALLILIGVGILLYELHIDRMHKRRARQTRIRDWRKGRLEFMRETTHAGIATIALGGALLVIGTVLVSYVN